MTSKKYGQLVTPKVSITKAEKKRVREAGSDTQRIIVLGGGRGRTSVVHPSRINKV